MFNFYVGDYNYKDTYTIDNVKFIAQAPLQTKENWGKNYESCEEAALIMSHYNMNDIYFDKYVADKVIDQLNDYQEFTLGTERNKIHNPNSKQLYIRDITIREIQKLAKLYYGYTDKNSHIISNPSEETIKYLISNDYVIIVPSYTKTLANPNFNLLTNSYHVINLVGYDKSNFIAHDPGTSKGELYKYPYKNVLKGIQENGDDILVLEGKRNQDHISFGYINDKIVLAKRVSLVLNRVNKILDKYPDKKELLLSNAISNIKKITISKVDLKDLEFYNVLTAKLEEKRQLALNEKQSVSYLSGLADKIKKYYEGR
ncbi:MAG: C39 family peptidase [Candidatus Gracilibacteria bacterium]|nr:C39 family peptidase [Candidatus Gracilibacteria bacterium]